MRLMRVSMRPSCVSSAAAARQAPKDFTIQLPVDEGFKDLSDQLPKDGSNNPRGTLTVTVTHVNIATSTPAGGYAYGYSPAGANAKIDYDID